MSQLPGILFLFVVFSMSLLFVKHVYCCLGVNNFGFGVFFPIVAAWKVKLLLLLGDEGPLKHVKCKVIVSNNV